MKIVGIYRNYFHGKGYGAYKSEESQRLFLDGLIKLTEKLFWLPIVSLVALILKPSMASSGILVACSVLFFLAMAMRHYVLTEIDKINQSNNEKEIFSRFKGRSNRKCHCCNKTITSL